MAASPCLPEEEADTIAPSMMMPLPMAASPRIPEEEDTVVAVVIRCVHAMVMSPCLPEEEADTVPPHNILHPPPTITNMTIDMIAERTVDK